MFIILGLGNPGDEYQNTRHNTGRIILETFLRGHNFPDWQTDKKSKALLSEGKIKKEKVTLVLPETFMNKSGVTASALVKNRKQAGQLIVIHDDLDLPIGRFKIVFNRGSGGHRGVESIMRAIKTEEFTRIKVGISPVTPSGKIKKPSGGKAVEAHILSEFKKSEMDTLKKTAKKISEAIEIAVTEGREKAMGEFNNL